MGCKGCGEEGPPGLAPVSGEQLASVSPALASGKSFGAGVEEGSGGMGGHIFYRTYKSYNLQWIIKLINLDIFFFKKKEQSHWTNQYF